LFRVKSELSLFFVTQTNYPDLGSGWIIYRKGDVRKDFDPEVRRRSKQGNIARKFRPSRPLDRTMNQVLVYREAEATGDHQCDEQRTPAFRQPGQIAWQCSASL